MKTLSILQPWAGLLVMGIKEFETRSFNTKVRGTIAIHASARMPKEGKDLLEWLGEQNPDFLPGTYKYKVCTTLGCVLGQVEITGTYSTNNVENLLQINSREGRLGNYHVDRFFWKCESPVLFDSPFPAKGQLGFWKWESPLTP